MSLGAKVAVVTLTLGTGVIGAYVFINEGFIGGSDNSETNDEVVANTTSEKEESKEKNEQVPEVKVQSEDVSNRDSSESELQTITNTKETNSERSWFPRWIKFW